jgi:hypothetical protein
MILVVLVPLRLDAAEAAAEKPVGHPRIRVTAPSLSGKRLVGVLVSLDETTLRIEREEGQPPIAVPRASITKIETSRHGSRKGQGAAIGLLFGVATAVVVGVTAGSDCAKADDGDPYFHFGTILCYNRSETTAFTAVLTVPLGALLGAVGSPGEKWEVMGADRLRLAVTPARGGGVRAAVALRF